MKKPTIVTPASPLFNELMNDKDFELAGTIEDEIRRRLFIFGRREEPDPSNPFSRKWVGYVIVCNSRDGMQFLEEHRFQVTNNSEGSATAVGAGGSSPAMSSLQEAPLLTGVTVVGHVDRGPFTPYHAFRWTEGGGVADLGTLAPSENANRSSFARGVASDGSVVVGYSDIANGVAQHAFRWTASSGMTDLGAPAGPTRNSRAHDVSSSGSVVVGEAEFNDQAAFIGYRNSAFRWTAATGMQNLGALQPGYFTRANDVTPDGSIVVGEGGIEIVTGNSSTNGSRAFRWSASSGLQNIGTLTGHRFAVANSASDDGRVIVGTSSPETGSSVAFRWTQTTGMQDLRQLLVNAGLNMTGIQLLTAVSVTGNGQIITGLARFPTTPVAENDSYFVQFCDAATVSPCNEIIFEPLTPDFSLTAGGSTALNVVSGRTVSAVLTITPTGGFDRAVGFSCSGLPALTTCSFSPATVTAGSSASTTLTISTTAPSFALTGSGWISVAILGVLLLPAYRRPWNSSGMRRVRYALPVAIVVIMSCGGGGDSDGTTEPPPPPPPSGGTPAGSYAVTVTATSTTGTPVVTKTVALTLNVSR